MVVKQIYSGAAFWFLGWQKCQKYITMAASRVNKLNTKKKPQKGANPSKTKHAPTRVADRPPIKRCPFQHSVKLHPKFAAMIHSRKLLRFRCQD